MTTLQASLAGLGFGVGLVMVIFWFFDVPMTVDKRGEVKQWVRDGGYRLVAAAVLLVALLAMTKMVALACAVAGLVAFWPQLFGAAKEAQVHIKQLEALATWTEALRDTIASGAGMLEALRSTTTRPPDVLAVPLSDLSARLFNREPLEECLRVLAEDLDDVVADQMLSALILNSRSQGRQLQAVLTGLAESTRKVVESRQEIEAERQKMRRGVQIIVALIGLMMFAMFTFGGSYVEPYATFAGQIVLTLVMGLFAVGFLVMRRLAIIQTPDRFLRGGNG